MNDEIGYPDSRQDCIPTPLKDFQVAHCRHCNRQCDPNEPKMLACILSAMLQTQAYRHKLYNEKGW